MVSLGQKLGSLEVSEASANKRAEHAEKMYQLSKGLKFREICNSILFISIQAIYQNSVPKILSVFHLEQIIELEKEKHELEENSLQKLSIYPSELPIVDQLRSAASSEVCYRIFTWKNKI